jgi:pimeloyl-ACP methyl ester carboxylesterase
MTKAIHDVSPPGSPRTFGAAKLSGFLDGGPDDRPPLVLLHGLTFDHRMWAPALGALRMVDPSRRVLTLDLPGHGNSPLLPDCDPEAVAAAVASAIEDAELDVPMAAIIVTIYACVYPTRGVVNVDQELDTTFAHMLQANREAITGPGFAQIWPAILESMRIDVLPESAQRLLNTELPRQDVVLAYWRSALEGTPADMDARVTETVAILRRQQIPYLVVAGHQYDAAYTGRLGRLLPQATVTVLPNSGHFPHLAHPDRFAQLLASTGQVRLHAAGSS